MEGTLVYLKPSIVGDEPEDVQQYAAAHAEFPHQTTADQWFDESQFESYRELGYHAATTALGAACRYQPNPCLFKENFFEVLEQIWHPPSPAVAKHFVSLAEGYDAMIERIRKDRNLIAMDKDFLGLEPPAHGERDKWKDFAEILNRLKAETHEQYRSIFYFCCSLIQLMENVYVDLDLEANLKHPDNQGWMKIFRKWADSEHFQNAWKTSRHFYGTRFVRFCQKEFFAKKAKNA